MKAKLEIQNIGKYQEKKTFSFESGLLTRVRGANAIGKTLLIKSIATALSCPLESPDLIVEGKKFGIPGPLLNNDSDWGTINLQVGDVNYLIEIDRKNISVKSDIDGEEKFLYAGILMKNSRMREAISRGEADFTWIIDEMSLSAEYQVYLDIVNSNIESIEIKKAELKEKIDSIKDLRVNADKLKEKLPENQKKLEEIEERLKNIAGSESEQEKINKLNPKLKKIEKTIVAIEKDLKKTERDLQSKRKQLDELKNKLKKYSKTEEDLTKAKKELEKIDPKKLKDQIIELQSVLGPLREKKGKIDGKKEIYEFALKRTETREGKIICPLCAIGEINIAEINDQILSFDDEIVTIHNKMDGIISEINNLQSQMRRRETEYPKIRSQFENFSKEKAQSKENELEIENSIDRLQQVLSASQKNIEPLKKTKLDLETQISKIEESIKGRNKESSGLFVERDKIRERLVEIRTKIDQFQDTISEGNKLEFFDSKIEVTSLENIIPPLLGTIESIRSSIIERIKFQRRSAAENFNVAIKKILDELQFSEIESVQINLNNFNLEVYSTGGKLRNLASLSGAEEGVIAALLQLSCKEAYLPDIPFFIADDSLLDLDPSRAKKLEAYLKTVARERDWFIIIVELTDDREIKIVEMN